MPKEATVFSSFSISCRCPAQSESKPLAQDGQSSALLCVCVCVFVPTQGPVTVLALSNDYSRLVTAGKDSTLFFFSVSPAGALTPECYVKLPSVALSAAWAADNGTVLLGLDNGVVVEVNVPTPGSVDTHKTFEVRTRTPACSLNVLY